MKTFHGHEFEQALGDGEGQGSLACCSPWGHKKSDTTERLNNNENKSYMAQCSPALPILFPINYSKYPDATIT